jgi:hypothetical protein
MQRVKRTTEQTDFQFNIQSLELRVTQRQGCFQLQSASGTRCVSIPIPEFATTNEHE